MSVRIEDICFVLNSLNNSFSTSSMQMVNIYDTWESYKHTLNSNMYQ